MYYVYILKSSSVDSFYIGYTNDLRRRLYEHNVGLSKSTRGKSPWVLIYYEAYRDKEDAIVRERRLKRYGKGLAMLKKRLAHSAIIS